MSTVTRFAPSPTGLLHVGHAHAAIFAERMAREEEGRFLLRIEDIDRGRCRTEFVDAIYEDLQWLGVTWDEEPWIQSKHMDHYRAAIDKLDESGLLYPCFCTRREIQIEIARAGAAPQGAEAPRYPGTCRGLSKKERQKRKDAGEAYALRLDMQRAVGAAGDLYWEDDLRGEIKAEPLDQGDVVLARKDCPTSYHLAVTVDDAAQGITLVTRGQDLFAATHVHRLLQALLDLPVPRWRHHGLIRDEFGERLAKRNDGLAIRTLRDKGWSPARVRASSGFPD